MNPNTEYERFAQEIYQELINADGIRTIDVKHNVNLVGKSGQEHQIDVYWEYEYAGVKHKIAIECKNYNSTVQIGKVRDFYGLLYDLNNVSGIMVTKVGYQTGAKKYAAFYGIDLKEIRTPNWGEAIIGEIELNIDTATRQCLFLVDEEWAKDKNIDLQRYRNNLDMMSISWPPKNEWANATHIPLEIVTNAKIITEKGRIITTFDKLERKLPEKPESGSECIYDFQSAYVDTRYWGRVKIKEIKYTFKEERKTTVLAIDAKDFVKAILKDAINGEIKLIAKN